MKNINQIYLLVKESILDESIKDDAIKKFGHSEEVQTYVNKFWNEIRQKETDIKKKDINYWLKEGYPAFKEYIDNFKSGKQEKKESQNLTSVDDGNGMLLTVVDDYELWQVDSYEASKILGRNYKNMPSKWCISSDEKEHWDSYYGEYYMDDEENLNTRFYFLISKIRHGPALSEDIRYDKIAITVDKDNKMGIYDLYDNGIPGEEVNANAGKPKKVEELPKNIQNIFKKVKNKLKWYDPLTIKHLNDAKNNKAQKIFADIKISADFSKLCELSLTKLPDWMANIAIVKGNFYCNNNRLTSLKGCPKEVGEDFNCSNNLLTSLEGGPEKVGGSFYCSDNQLTSLEGCPKEIGDDFYCFDNKLTSLEGCPKEVGRDFSCSNNKLTSLEGCPKEVGGDFCCWNNQLTSLEGCPKEVEGEFRCNNNKLTSLDGCPKVVIGNFWCQNNPGKFTEEDVRKVCKVHGVIVV